jgi:hypothetical protein
VGNDSIYKTAVSKRCLNSRATSKEYQTYSPSIKPSLLTPLLNYIGTSGYYNPFTSEAQMNYQMPVFNRPFVACHEMSHQMGYGAEDEANFVGFWPHWLSDRLLRYSAYNVAVNEFMHTVCAILIHWCLNSLKHGSPRRYWPILKKNAFIGYRTRIK